MFVSVLDRQRAILEDGCHHTVLWQLMVTLWACRPHPFLCYQKCLLLVALGSFQSGRAFTVHRAVTIESSLMSGCGQGHKTTQNSLCLTFPVLTPSRNGNADQTERRYQ